LLGELRSHDIDKRKGRLLGGCREEQKQLNASQEKGKRRAKGKKRVEQKDILVFQ
jgi:hypothetical protein